MKKVHVIVEFEPETSVVTGLLCSEEIESVDAWRALCAGIVGAAVDAEKTLEQTLAAVREIHRGVVNTGDKIVSRDSRAIN